MRGAKARALRKLAYGDLSTRREGRKYGVANSGQIVEMGPRRYYQSLKRGTPLAPGGVKGAQPNPVKRARRAHQAQARQDKGKGTGSFLSMLLSGLNLNRR